MPCSFFSLFEHVFVILNCFFFFNNLLPSTSLFSREKEEATRHSLSVLFYLVFTFQISCSILIMSMVTPVETAKLSP